MPSQHLVVVAHPDRFFVPPYVGPSGWVGVWLDRNVDWQELAGLLHDGYRLIAPKRLVATLDAGSTAGSSRRSAEAAQADVPRPKRDTRHT